MNPDLIRTYRVLPESFCDGLTDWFEASPSFHVKRDDRYKHFTEVNVNDKEPNLIIPCQNYLLTALDRYREDLPEYSQFLEPRALEEFRIKRYLTDQDEFRNHVDVGDKKSCKRQLAFLFYLNDNFDGGQTKFQDRLISPSKGDILVFPPMWMFPHSGLPVTRGVKYIMSSYLHYT